MGRGGGVRSISVALSALYLHTQRERERKEKREPCVYPQHSLPLPGMPVPGLDSRTNARLTPIRETTCMYARTTAAARTDETMTGQAGIDPSPGDRSKIIFPLAAAASSQAPPACALHAANFRGEGDPTPGLGCFHRPAPHLIRWSSPTGLM